MKSHALAAGLGAFCALTAPAQISPPVTFEDVTQAAGIVAVPRSFGGCGGAFLDYDGDGWQDFLIVGGDRAPALYRNMGDGRFTDVSAAAGVDRPPVRLEWYMSVTVGDYDNDGDPDIYLGTWGPNVLFRNEGDGTFADVTTPAVAGYGYTAGAAFGDYDGDGLLDLYVGNYIAGFNWPYHVPDPNVLLHNEGNSQFTDVTAECDVAGAGTTFAVSWSDFDGDGDVDLWVGNDFGAEVQSNLLYRNDGRQPDGSWGLTEVAESLGADAPIYCMGIAAGDFDRDLDLDYYFSNLGRNLLLRNDGPGGFSDVTDATGTQYTFDPTSPSKWATSWGIGFCDFDLDGWLDLYVSNGHVPLVPISNGETTPNVLFHHDGPSLTFTEIGGPAGIADQGWGRGAAFADFDNDGAPDILQVDSDGRVLLFRNTTRDRGHWLKFLPQGRSSPRDGVGAKVRVDLPGFSLVREVNRNYSFESSSELAVLFGLGEESEIQRLEVSWPSGIQHRFHYLPADLAVTLVEPVVTVGSGSGVTGDVVEGTTAIIHLELINHTQVPQTVWHVPQVRVFGELLWSGPVSRSLVPGSGVVDLSYPLDVPLGTEGVPVEFLWAVYDAGFGVDQMKAGFEIKRGLMRNSNGGSSRRKVPPIRR